MSLAKMALRIAAVQAIKSAATLVGDNVFDSKIAVFDQTADGRLSTEQKMPFVAVYTDSAETDDLARSGLRANGKVTLVFNYGVSLSMMVTNKETGAVTLSASGDAEQWVQGIPTTDDHFEALIDIIEVQLLRALADTTTVWGDIFGGLVLGYESKQSLRSNSKAEDVRLAAGQILLTVSVLGDPIHNQGLPTDGVWSKLLSQLQADDLHQYELFSGLLGDTETEPSNDYQRLLSMTEQTARSLQLFTEAGVPVGTSFAPETTVSG